MRACSWNRPGHRGSAFGRVVGRVRPRLRGRRWSRPTTKDAAAAGRLLEAADSLAALIDRSDALFDRDGSVPLNEAEKAELLAIYAPLADYLTGMDVLRARFRSGARATSRVTPRSARIRWR